jgi:hypothetical protein
MLIWMLHFTQQLGGLSSFHPGTPYGNFVFNLVDTVQRMAVADTLTGSRSITCLAHDLVTLRSLRRSPPLALLHNPKPLTFSRSFNAPTNSNLALQMADAIFGSANDLGDDHAITEALKLYRRVVRLKPSAGVAWWGVGNCFEFWGARRCSANSSNACALIRLLKCLRVNYIAEMLL